MLKSQCRWPEKENMTDTFYSNPKLSSHATVSHCFFSVLPLILPAIRIWFFTLANLALDFSTGPSKCKELFQKQEMYK